MTQRLKSRTPLIFLLFLLFLGAGLVTAYLSFQPELPASVAEKISSNLEQQLKYLESEATQVKNTLRDTIITTPETSCPFFLYDHGRLVQWSNNQWVPPVSIFADTFDIKLIHDGNVDNLVRRWNISSDKFLVSVIPLQRSFKITNEYVSPEWNEEIFPSGNIRVLDANSTLGTPVCANGRCLFRVSFFKEDMPSHVRTKFSWQRRCSSYLHIDFFQL